MAANISDATFADLPRLVEKAGAQSEILPFLLASRPVRRSTVQESSLLCVIQTYHFVDN